MDSPAVSSRLFSTTLTFRTPQENHIVSVPFETIEKTKKNVFSIFFVQPGHHRTIQYLIPGWMTIVKIAKTSEKLAKSLPGPLVKLSNLLPGRRQRSKLIIIPAGKKTIQRQFADAQGTPSASIVSTSRRRSLEPTVSCIARTHPYLSLFCV